MTNKQILVLNEMVRIAENVAGVTFAGLYPDSMQDIGQRFPAVIVRDGNEDAPAFSTGQNVHYTYTPDVIVIHEVNTFTTRIADILSLQNEIVTKLITDLSMSGLVHNVNGYSVSKGTDQDILAEASAGYQGEISVSVITLNLTIKDTRS